MTHDERLDEELTRLLASVRADADPALWTRVCARIEARERRRAPGWLVWAMRPAALGTSVAVFAAAAVTSAVLIATTPRTLPLGSADSLAEALVAELETQTTQTTAPSSPGPGAVTDSGGIQ